jgi:hypothetical protein
MHDDFPRDEDFIGRRPDTIAPDVKSTLILSRAFEALGTRA